MKIKSITATMIAPMSDHAANRGEKLLGNASSIKRRPDGRVYISGQMQRHAFFSALDRINADHPQRGDTYVANGDAPATCLLHDLRSDLGGFLDTKKGDYSGRRTAPLTATPAVALESSSVGRDLLIRLKMDDNRKTGRNADEQAASGESEKKQALATNEYSQRDEMLMSFHLDVGGVGIVRQPRYEQERHLGNSYVPSVSAEERRRRIRMSLEAMCSLTDYANQARNATSGEPNRILIVLDPKMSRKAARYFASETSDAERANMRRELEARGALVFEGDDTRIDGDSVYDAVQKALAALDANELHDPAEA